jgi:hypothetical protein
VTSKKKHPSRKRKPTGPEPERLKIEGRWQDAVKRAIKRGKPPAKKKATERKKKTK